MKKILTLTKIFLKSSFSNMNAKMGISLNGKSKYLSKILYGILFLYLGGIIILFSYGMIDGLKSINQETTFIGLILFSILGVTTIQSIFSSINILYFTKDSEYLLPLPLKPYQIILARTNVLIILEYVITILIGFIPLLLYGILTNMGIVYYITMIISLILLPILPILLVSIIVMIIMSFAKLTKNKNRFQLIATILVLIIVIALSLSANSIDENMTDEQLAQMLVQANSMVELIKGYFPTLDYLTNALTSNSLSIILLELIKTAGLTILGLIIYVLVSQKLYLKGLVGNLFSSGSKKVNTKIKQEQYKNSKLYKSYISKEFKTLIRNPIFLMQCLLPAILMPILMIALLYIQFKGDGTSEVNTIFEGINVNSFGVSCVILGIIQFFSMFIYVSITAISRDGKNAVFIKYIPVSLYKQYIYKSIPNVIMNNLTTIITLIAVKLIINLPIVILILLFIISTIISLIQSILMIIIDLKRPKLEWDSEYAVVKQNFNLIFPVILSMINIAIIAITGFLLNTINLYIGLLILGIIFGFIAYITNRYLYKNQNRLADKII